jgi:Spy/CpxP family protein refolding chaperone
MSRARVLSAILLVVVFVAGVLVGAAADRALEPRSHRSWRHRHEAEILERLRLDPGQKTAVEEILARRRSEAGKVWRQVKPRLDQVVAGTRGDLSRVLTAEQLAEYDRLMAERWRRMQGRFDSENGKGRGEGGKL